MPRLLGEIARILDHPEKMDGESLKESRNDMPNEITNQSKEI